jgi:hypothetical protein
MPGCLKTVFLGRDSSSYCCLNLPGNRVLTLAWRLFALGQLCCFSSPSGYTVLTKVLQTVFLETLCSRQLERKYCEKFTHVSLTGYRAYTVAWEHRVYFFLETVYSTSEQFRCSDAIAWEQGAYY